MWEFYLLCSSYTPERWTTKDCLCNNCSNLTWGIHCSEVLQRISFPSSCTVRSKDSYTRKSCTRQQFCNIDGEIQVHIDFNRETKTNYVDHIIFENNTMSSPRRIPIEFYESEHDICRKISHSTRYYKGFSYKGQIIALIDMFILTLQKMSKILHQLESQKTQSDLVCCWEYPRHWPVQMRGPQKHILLFLSNLSQQVCASMNYRLRNQDGVRQQ